MNLSPVEICKADLAKLHEEVNQLRNNEFLVCSFALALVGAMAAELKQAPLVGLAILAVLLGLFYWHHTLIDTRSRITSYLRASKHSHWEIRYREFADQIPKSSQRTAGTVTFFVLGCVVPIIAFRDGLAAFVLGNPTEVLFGWLWAYLILGGAYVSAVVYFGRVRNYRKRIAEYEGRWVEILTRTKSLGGTEEIYLSTGDSPLSQD